MDVDDTAWPALPLEEWRDTYATLHRYSQIIGKVQLALMPRVNHWWNVAFHMTPRGWTTPPMAGGGGGFAIELDFIDHNLIVRTSRGAIRGLALVPRFVADFYREVLTILDAVGVRVAINTRPVEIAIDAIPFPNDRKHGAYDAEYAHRCWRILAQSSLVFEEFRARFIGKSSPVHFFWGSFDLALTRFSGRRAPERPGADPITREAYSHEVISAGFWPGDERLPKPAYYAYAAPAPSGLSAERPRPSAASWHAGLGEFVLPYDEVRRARSPRVALLEFLQSTYEAAANLAGWDRAQLERAEG